MLSHNENLNKTSARLVVAQDIALELPHGERYALIGPNGAGKTTLINLITGMLQPDAAQIFLAARRSPRCRRTLRVKGLARTFQINTLFPQLTRSKRSRSRCCERDGHAHNWWRGLRASARTRGAGILRSLRLESPAPGHARARVRPAAPARDRARARHAPEGAAARRAGGGRAEGRKRRAVRAIAGLSRELTMLFIEHDMERRVPLRQPHHRDGRRPHPAWKARPTSRRDRRVREVYLGKRAMLSCRGRAPATATPWCSTASRSSCRQRQPRRARPQRRAASPRCCCTIMGLHPAAGDLAVRRQDITPAAASARALGLGWVAQEREIFPSLTSRRTSPSRAAGPLGPGASTTCFPRLNERARNMGNQLSGGEQQMLADSRAR
jgi:branched-chain amino acid transport system ATP-binding protein